MILALVIAGLLALANQAQGQWFGSSAAYHSGNATEKVARLPGPRWSHTDTGCGCSMCEGNHLLAHGQSYAYLTSIGYAQWDTIHDNLHNAAASAERAKKRLASADVYAPTPEPIVDSMLAILMQGRPAAGQIVYDLGSGDGRFLIAGARDYQAKTIGLELDPDLVALSRQKIEAVGLEHKAIVYQLDATTTRLDNADAIVVYLTEETLGKLVPRFKELRQGVRIASYMHAVPGCEPLETWRGNGHAVYVYETPLDRPKPAMVAKVI